MGWLIAMLIVVTAGALAYAALWARKLAPKMAPDVLPPMATPLSGAIVLHLYDGAGNLRHEVNIHHQESYEFPPTYEYAGVVYGYVDLHEGMGRYRAG